MSTARTSVDPKGPARHIRPPYASKVITRVRTQHQIAADNAKLIDAGLTPPAPALHGHSALHRQQRIDAYGQRLEMLMRADFERQAMRLSAFLGSIVHGIDAGHSDLTSVATFVAPTSAHLQ